MSGEESSEDPGGDFLKLRSLPLMSPPGAAQRQRGEASLPFLPMSALCLFPWGPRTRLISREHAQSRSLAWLRELYQSSEPEAPALETLAQKVQQFKKLPQ